MSKKLNSIQRELAGAFRSGNIFFVLYEILNLGHYLVNKLLYLMCIPLWNLSDRIKWKLKKTSPLSEKKTAENIEKINQIVKSFSAGEKLRASMEFQKMAEDPEYAKDIEEIRKKFPGRIS